nr:conserved hypothetical protein [Melanopsichium pennsylvanicum 4]
METCFNPSATGDGELSSDIHIGDFIYCSVTVALLAFSAMLFPETGESDRKILARVFVALCFMAIRVAFSTWHTFQVMFLGVNLCGKVGLDYVPEVLVVLTLVMIAYISRERDSFGSSKRYTYASTDHKYA